MKNRTFKNSKVCPNWRDISKCAVIACIAIGLNTNQCFAQSENNEFSFSVGGVFSSLDYDLKKGDINHRIGADLGLRYAYRLNTSWSLGIGMDYQSFASTAVLKELKDSYRVTDSENEEFEFRYSAKQYREEQNASLITIPLTVQYETQGSTRFYIAGGAKIGLPLKSEYQSRATSLKTSGYYAQYDSELFGPKFAGFGDFGKVESAKKDLDLKMTYIPDFGNWGETTSGKKQFHLCWNLSRLCLNDLYDGETNPDTPIASYGKNVPSTFTYNSLFETGGASYLKALAFGVKVRYAFGF